MNKLADIIRPDLLGLVPYSSARDDFSGRARIFLDANENPYGSSFRGVTGLNRYPDPHQSELKEMISLSEDIPAQNIFCGNGSDEIIDLLIRVTSVPGETNIIINTPTYGMYGVQAAINNTRVREVSLDPLFQPDVKAILDTADAGSRLIFICSPNNPTGNLAEESRVETLAKKFRGLLIIDEAYIDFSSGDGFKGLIDKYPNIVVLRTFSKARGLAGARLGVAFANEQLVNLLDSIKLPYNINSLTIAAAMNSLRKPEVWRSQAQRIIAQREKLVSSLQVTDGIRKIYPSDANFILVRVDRPKQLYIYLAERGIVIRDRSQLKGCEGCVRITVGTENENEYLLQGIKDFLSGDAGDSSKSIRESVRRRQTRETDILADINLDGRGICDIQTGSGFFDHMLEQLTFHSGFDLLIRASGDIETGLHHTVEDIAITLGQAVAEALGKREGIRRYGFTLPMDDSLATIAIDMGGRSGIRWDAVFNGEMTGDIPVDMYSHFFSSFADAARCTINVKASGENDHHMAEAIFKAFGRVLKEAVLREDSTRLPSTKGMI